METIEIIKLVMKELKERKEKYGVDPVRITGADTIVSAGDMVSGITVSLPYGKKTAIPLRLTDVHNVLLFSYELYNEIVYLQIDYSKSETKEELVFDYNTIDESDGSSMRRRIVTYEEKSSGFRSKSERNFFRKGGIPRYDTVVVIGSGEDKCVRTLESTPDPMVFRKLKSDNIKIDFSEDPNKDPVLKKFLTEELLDRKMDEIIIHAKIYRKGEMKEAHFYNVRM